MEKLVLASTSPRRFDILSMLDVPFDVVAPEGEEILNEALALDAACLQVAMQKALSVCDKVDDDVLILASDTIVVVQNECLGKPKDVADACRMIALLQGGAHTVYTAVAFARKSVGIVEGFVEQTEVFVKPMTEEEITRYVATGEPMDKAGAYGVQGKFALFIERLDGDFFNVCGLPISAVYDRLKALRLGKDLRGAAHRTRHERRAARSAGLRSKLLERPAKGFTL